MPRGWDGPVEQRRHGLVARERDVVGIARVNAARALCEGKQLVVQAKTDHVREHRARAYPVHVYPYPACSKKFPHSWALKERTIRPILRQSPSIVRSAAVRRCSFTLLKPCSIGLKSGEYCGRYFNRAPTASIASRTPATL